MDHYGLMDWVHPEIPIFLSKDSQTVLEVGNIFFPPSLTQKKIFSHCHNFDHWKSFTIGHFTITSYLTDHSAFGSSSLLIEVEGEKILYTGDLRGHGNKAKLFEWFVKNPIKDIDVLLMEGTTLGSEHHIGYKNEKEVKKEMERTFSSQKDVSFIMAAGSNIDRIVSIYKAVKRAKKKLILDLYQIYLLNRLKERSPGLPPHPDDDIRILYIHNHTESIVKKLGKQILYDYKSRKINIEEILKDRDKMVLRIPLSSMNNIAKRMSKTRPLSNANFIYSMWSGYLKSDPKFIQFCETYQIQLKEIHTSGHAYFYDLKRLVGALNPKYLMPIHTLHGDDFKNYFPNVIRTNDGESFKIS